MNLHVKIALLRARKSQIDLARETGLGESTVSRIVNEYRLPTAEEKMKIAGALGCDVGELWPGGEIGVADCGASAAGR